MRLDYHKVPLQTLHPCEHLRIRVSSEDRRGLLRAQMAGQKVDRLEDQRVGPRVDRLEDQRVAPKVDRSEDQRVGPKVDRLEDQRAGPKVDRLEDQRVGLTRAALPDLLEEEVVWIPYELPVLPELGPPLRLLQRVVQGA